MSTHTDKSVHACKFPRVEQRYICSQPLQCASIYTVYSTCFMLCSVVVCADVSVRANECMCVVCFAPPFQIEFALLFPRWINGYGRVIVIHTHTHAYTHAYKRTYTRSRSLFISLVLFALCDWLYPPDWHFQSVLRDMKPLNNRICNDNNTSTSVWYIGWWRLPSVVDLQFLSLCQNTVVRYTVN